MKVIRLTVLVPDDEADTLDKAPNLLEVFLEYVSPPNDFGVVSSISMEDPARSDYLAAGMEA